MNQSFSTVPIKIATSNQTNSTTNSVAVGEGLVTSVPGFLCTNPNNKNNNKVLSIL